MKNKTRHRRAVILAVTGLVILALYFGASLVVSPILHRKLDAMVASHLKADLHIGHLRYRFPYGVTATDVSLVPHDGGAVEIFKAKRIDLVLAELPHHDGPLVIKKLILDEPSIRIVRNAQGNIEGHDMVRHDDPSPQVGPAKMKLSDMFRLRRFAIQNARVIYIDHRKKDSPPMEWGGIHVDLNTEPQSGALYDYNVAAGGPLSKTSAGGTIDIDALRLDVKRFDMSIEVKAGAPPEELPASVQELLKSYPMSGQLKLNGTATIPLKNPMESKYDATLDLPGMTARLPQWDASLDKLALQLRICNEMLPVEEGGVATTRPAGDKSACMRIARFEAISGESRFKIDQGMLTVDRASGAWRVHDMLGSLDIGQTHTTLPTGLRNLLDNLRATGGLRFTATANGPLKPPPGKRLIESIKYELLATPRHVTLQPKGFPLPLEKLTGSIRLKPGVVAVENLEARYGVDRVIVTSARLPLDDVQHLVRIEDLTGSVDFAGKTQRYPKALNATLRVLRPKGICVVNGSVTVHPGQPNTTEYKIGISSDRASLDVAFDGHDRRLPATDLKTDILITGVGKEGLVEITSAEAAMLNGRFSGHGRVTIHKPLTYEAKGHLAEIDLPALARVWTIPGEETPHWTGRGYADLTVNGSGPRDGKETLDLLHGEGEFDILEGDYFQIPVLKDIAASISLPKGAATVGEAAGTVTIHDRIFSFDHAAVSSPVLGLQGSGTIGFEGIIDMRVIAAPLADWKASMKRTGIPIVSDVTGEIVGGVQKILNGATRTLLYEFRVTGKLPKPAVETVPVPALKDGAAKLFGTMISPPKGEKLLDEVKKVK